MSSDKEIFFCVEELENNESTNFDISKLMAEIEEAELNEDLTVPYMMNYSENFTIKELMLICEYYGFAKEIKQNKMNKEQIIHFLVNFETNPINAEIVFKRQNMWFYINELKNDKFMKKFVLW